MRLIESRARIGCKRFQSADYGWLTIRMPGHLVRGGAGMRKVRWALPGGGKSGGIRVLYYCRASAEQIYLLFLFANGERSDLTPEQVRELARYVRELK
jgi:hypothetical protein